MNAQTRHSPCSLQVIRTPVETLYQYQLLLHCPGNGETIQYSMDVIKQGKSGTSRNRQSGQVTLNQPQLVLGDLRINESERDSVTVKASVLDQQQEIIAEVTRHFPDRPGS